MSRVRGGLRMIGVLAKVASSLIYGLPPLAFLVFHVEPLLFAREESHYLHRDIQELDRIIRGPRLAAELPPSVFSLLFFHRFVTVLSCHF